VADGGDEVVVAIGRPRVEVGAVELREGTSWGDDNATEGKQRSNSSDGGGPRRQLRPSPLDHGTRADQAPASPDLALSTSDLPPLHRAATMAGGATMGEGAEGHGRPVDSRCRLPRTGAMWYHLRLVLINPNKTRIIWTQSKHLWHVAINKVS
jgi:hypothetical protein